MKIESITLQNFGPYFGEQKIELSTSEDAPIILIHGENMRGKTHLLHAILWGLYGKVKAHSGETLDDSDFANWDKRDAGSPFEVGVTIEFSERNENYVLKREFTCEKDPLNEKNVSISSSKLSLMPSSENPIPREDIRERINSILHEEIAELFLFDGETLSAFEQKLRTPHVSNKFIKESIEKALGLSSITSTIRDLEVLKSRLGAERKEELKLEKSATKAINELDEKEDLLRRTSEDLVKVQAILERASETKVRLQPTIDASATLREKHEHVAELEEDINRLEDNVRNNKDLIQSSFHYSYWMPINSKIQGRRIELEDSISDVTQRISAINSDLVRESDLIRTIEDEICVVCAQGIDTIASKKLHAALESLQANDRSSSDLRDLHLTLVQAQKELRVFTDTSAELDRIVDLDAQIREDQLRIDSKKGAISDLLKLLDSTDINFEEIGNQYNKAIAESQNASEAIPSLQAQISALKGEIKLLGEQLSTMQKKDSPLKSKIEIVDILIEIYTDSIDEFSNRMRKEVERVSSKIFKSLTSEPDYQGLRINQNYYLEIIDANDRVIQRRSAGAEQVVAMSLIGALVECSVRDAPVVIDTPLGRLDDTHRKNILKWLPNIGSQVMLLVTSTEFREPEDRSYLGDKVGREYELAHISATHTEVRKRSR